MALTHEIRQRAETVQARVAAAAERAHRDPRHIEIVAIAKTHPPAVIRAGYEAGLRLFGENRVEEAIPKQRDLVDLSDLSWHMVGHIQTRKAKRVAGAFELIHSVDRAKLARRLNTAAEQAAIKIPILLECNVSGEFSKHGWPLMARATWGEVVDEFSEMRLLPHLEVRGLMTLAPIAPDPEEVRPVFRKLRELRDFLRDRVPGDWNQLSMGMTDDYEVAVEEGATILRIGRAIFGERGAG